MLIMNRVSVTLVAVSMASVLVFWLESYARSDRLLTREQALRSAIAQPMAHPVIPQTVYGR